MGVALGRCGEGWSWGVVLGAGRGDVTEVSRSMGAVIVGRAGVLGAERGTGCSGWFWGRCKGRAIAAGSRCERAVMEAVQGGGVELRAFREAVLGPPFGDPGGVVRGSGFDWGFRFRGRCWRGVAGTRSGYLLLTGSCWFS